MSDLICRTLAEHAEGLAKKEYSARELTLAYLRRIEEEDRAIGAYLCVLSEEALAAAREVDRARAEGRELSLLAGIPMAMKDNLCTRGIPTTCASRILNDYRPPYDATVWERLRSAGAILLGKTNMDEFGMGSTTEHSARQITKNPLDPTLTPGGSSGGSAAAVAAKEAAWALGTDTGGSVRQPAAFCGLVGMRPTYGTVSRYGLVAYASSFDTVGPITRTVADNAMALEAMIGEDPRDATSRTHPDPRFSRGIGEGVCGLRIGLVKEALASVEDEAVRNTLVSAAERYRAMGAQIVEISVPALTYSAAAYCVMACAEASSNLARYDGVRYGRRAERYESVEDLFHASRSEGFGAEVKRRLLLGTYVLSGGCAEGYYRRARAVRERLRDELREAFSSCDLLLMPVAPTPPFRLGEKTEQTALRFSEDLYCAPASLCGLPALSLPAGRTEGGLPIGIQLMGAPFSEGVLYRAGVCLEKEAKE